MNNIIFTTAYKDISRKNWTSYKRTNNDYLDGFYNLANNIQYPLIVYLEDNFKNEILLNKE